MGVFFRHTTAVRSLPISTASPISDTYDEARSRFRLAAARAGFETSSIIQPGKGPLGEELAIDIATRGLDGARTAVLCLSGVHGAEGYAGSGAQVAWLEAVGSESLPPGVGILMVHGLNSWGFAHGLRGTEDNIDLNRNYLDHAQPHPENPLYAEIHPALCPPDLSPPRIDALLDAGQRFVERHGQWALEDAISRGQYTHPDGYHYGGRSLARPLVQLEALVAEKLGSIEHLAYVDFHSGPIGDGETIFLCFSPDDSAMRRRAEMWWGRDALRRETVERQWGSRRPGRSGILFRGLENLLAGRADIAGAVVEFCSAQPRRSERDIMRIPMLERWLRFEGGLEAAEAPAYLAEIRTNYAPRRDNWEARVAARAIDVLARALKGAADWSQEP